MEINVQQYFLVNYYIFNITLRFSEDLHCMCTNTYKLIGEYYIKC